MQKMFYTIRKTGNFFPLMRKLYVVLVMPFPEGDCHYRDVMEGLEHRKAEVRLKGLEEICSEDKQERL